MFPLSRQCQARGGESQPQCGKCIIFVADLFFIMKKIKLLFAIALFGALMVACNKDELFMEIADNEIFEREYTAWSKQIINNYQFVYEYRSLHLPFYGPVKITIEDGRESVIEHPYDYIENVPYKSITQIYALLINIFDTIGEIKKGTYSHYKVESVTLRIDYDTQYHYPKNIFYALSLTDKGIPVPGSPSVKMEVIDFLPN